MTRISTAEINEDAPICDKRPCGGRKMTWHRITVNMTTGLKLPVPRDEWYCGRCGKTKQLLEDGSFADVY